MAWGVACGRARVRSALWVSALAAAVALGSSPAWAASAAPAEAKRGMVVTSQADATRAGVGVLESGGNAVDAAVAAAFAVGSFAFGFRRRFGNTRLKLTLGMSR